jgi:hypothetical protein
MEYGNKGIIDSLAAADKRALRMAFSKLIFHLFLLLMAQGRTKDGLCITEVSAPHPSNSPPR